MIADVNLALILPWTFEALRYAGAAYLLFLAFKAAPLVRGDLRRRWPQDPHGQARLSGRIG